MASFRAQERRARKASAKTAPRTIRDSSDKARCDLVRVSLPMNAGPNMRP
jgi:hypothetical protein